VYVTSTAGGPIPAGALSVRSKSGQTVYSEPIKQYGAIRLPYGEYTVTFQTQFIKAVSRKVVIATREAFLVLGTNMEDYVLDMPNDPVSVSIRARPSDSCASGQVLWAKLAGVFSDYVAEQKIGPGGYALFEPVEVGTYVVLVVDGTKVRATEILSTKGPITTVDVPLSPCSASSPGR
jgi:hypothetical protein